MTQLRKTVAAMALALVPFSASVHATSAISSAQTPGLADLSLEELSDLVITSVARRDQSLLKAAASVYIISGDDIRRLGATTLPEALRLAPNLQVAAIDARQYAISARGFNGNVANKLLVLVDGRTVYSPLFSGVFWDAQDFVPADIARIEVISGAAGATWGTNAVNGVINVVTRSAAATEGPAASLTVGSLERTAVARHGVAVSQDLSVRVHARTFHRDASRLSNGKTQDDASTGNAAGFRADWSSGKDTVKVTGGLYEGSTDVRPVYGPVDLRGSNLAGNWRRRLTERSDIDVQLYFDSTTRSDKFQLQDAADIFDMETKYRHTVGDHQWLAGLGLRRANDRADPGGIFAFLPPSQHQSWASAFVQDEIDLSNKLALTLGLRMERNPYTSWEALPNVRLGYNLSAEAQLWAALSRAVRSPARFDREIYAPARPPYIIAGGPGFVSETAKVAEMGYRQQLGPRASLSMTAFLHDFDRLRSGEVAGGQLIIANQIKGQVRGIEAWGNWQAVEPWRLDLGLLLLDKDLHLQPGSTDPTGPDNLGNDPTVQWSLRSNHALAAGFDLAVAIRHVGRLPVRNIPAYTATDLTLNWAVGKAVRLTAGVRDLFDKGHVEYQGFTTLSEIPRSGFISVTYGI